MEKAPIITLQELKKAIAKLEEDYQLSGDTEVFLDTGWDSIQEIAPNALSVEEIQGFSVEDPLTKEMFGGYSLLEKADAMKASGVTKKALIIRNLY